MTHPVVGLLHPGRMGAAVAAQARRNGATVLWCPGGRSPGTIQRAQEAGLTPCDQVSDLLGQATIVLSICAPIGAEDVAATAASAAYEGIYVEANAIDPARFLRIRDDLGPRASVIDAAIFGPPPSDDRSITLYLAGAAEQVDPIEAIFAGTSVRTTHLMQEPPAASALKMAHSSYQKASRALAAVAHALAGRYDVTGELLTEAERNSHSPLADPDHLPSVAARAWRWAPELRDVAQTLADNDLPPGMAAAAAEVLDRWQADKDNNELTTAEALKQLAR